MDDTQTNSPLDRQKASFTSQPLCPSAPPHSDGGVVFGVVLGTPEQPKVEYLSDPQPASAEILALASPSEPDEVFRIAAPCTKDKCRHFDGVQCSLVERSVRILPIVMAILPPCRIRSHCQWWHQENKAACLRCAQVVTIYPNLPQEYQSLVYVKGEDDV